MSDNTDYTNLNFTEIKEDLKNFLKSQARFKDYDFEGSNMSVVLDILAYNTLHNNVYNNMVLSEMFMDSAQTKNAILSHAKELNYLPQSRRSAQATVRVRFTPAQKPSFITVPRNTVFTAKCGAKNYDFVASEATTITEVNGKYQADITILEGKVITEYFVVAAKNGRYRISNDSIDTSSIRLRVAKSQQAMDLGRFDEYLVLDSLHGATPDGKVFYLQPTENDCYQIEFGRGQFGYEPPVGSVIAVEYRVTMGSDANGAKDFVLRDMIENYPSVVTTVERAEGGSDRESLESIRFFAPKALQIQDRAVTERDYEILLKQKFPEIQAVSVYGGEEASPPQYGRVIIAVDVKNANGVSDALKEKYRTFLKDRTPLSIEPVVVNPKFMYVSVETTVTYDNRATELSEANIRQLVKSKILAHSVANLNNFRTTIRKSRLTRDIDNAHSSIASNDTLLRAVCEVVPFENKVLNSYINFGNRIIKEPVVNTNSYDSNRVPGIVSTAFVYRGRSCFIRDDGNGRLQIVTSSNGKVTVISADIGEINYETGLVRIKSFAVSGYSGSSIRLYGNTYSADFTSPKDRILAIREQDINITVKTV